MSIYTTVADSWKAWRREVKACQTRADWIELGNRVSHTGTMLPDWDSDERIAFQKSLKV